MFKKAKERQKKRREAALANQGPVLLTLEAVGPNKVQVVKVVMDATGLGIRESKDLVEAAPVPVFRFKEEVASAIQRRLEAVGAVARLDY